MRALSGPIRKFSFSLLTGVLAMAVSSITVAAGKSVTIGHFGVPTPWKAAAVDGAFEEATGWDIEWRRFDSGSKIYSAMASGDIKIAALGSSPIAAALAGGVDLEVFYVDKVFDSAEALAVRDGSGIVAPQDLRGKTVAAPVASTTHFHLLFALEQFNIPTSEVEILNLQPNEIAAAWARGDIDGAFVWNPALSQILQSGRVLLTSGQLAEWGKPTFDGFVGAPGFIAENPEFMRDFVKVLAEYNSEYNSNRASWTPSSGPVKKIANMTGASPEDVPGVLSGIGFLSLEQQASSQWLNGGVARSLKATSEFLKSQNKIDNISDDYGGFVNPTYVEQVRDSQ